MNNKQKVKNFWEEASCGEDLYLKGFNKDDYLLQSKIRYELEPQIIEFAEFKKFNSLKTLEIGVGLGSDHMMLAKNGARLSGVDITERAIAHTKRRFELLNLNSELQIGDAENLPFKGECFDSIYSWGVIHHSPNTQKSINEIYRVLKKDGFAKIMIYYLSDQEGHKIEYRQQVPAEISVRYIRDDIALTADEYNPEFNIGLEEGKKNVQLILNGRKLNPDEKLKAGIDIRNNDIILAEPEPEDEEEQKLEEVQEGGAKNHKRKVRKKTNKKRRKKTNKKRRISKSRNRKHNIRKSNTCKRNTRKRY